MKITSPENRRKDALPSTITAQDFGRAMSQLDLSAVPRHKRRAAILDHLARIQSETLASPTQRQAIAMARILHQKKRLADIGLIIPEGD